MESLRVFDQDGIAPNNMPVETRLLGLECLIVELLVKNQQLRHRLQEQEHVLSVRSADVGAHQLRAVSLFRSS
jgi:hypothetical protein